MFWVTELTEFGSDFQLHFLQNNDCNSENLHLPYTGNAANWHVYSDLCVKFLHKTSLKILTYLLKNLTTPSDTEKDYANIKKEKSLQFRKMKSQ